MRFKQSKILFWSLLAVLLLTSNQRSSSYSCCTPKTYFLPRPQGLNSPALFNPYWYDCNSSESRYAFTSGFRYSQSRKPEKISQSILCGTSLSFSGTKVQDFENTMGSIRADDLGLAPNFLGALEICPRIKNYMIDLDLRINLNNPCDCTLGVGYLRLTGSVVRSDWDLNAREAHIDSDTKTFNKLPKNYMSIEENESAKNLEEALSGKFLFGDKKTEREFGNITFCRQKETKLANLDIILGYDFSDCCDYHFGTFIKAVAPTGNRPDQTALFKPIIGNGKHWELGGGVNLHYDLYRCDDAYLQIYADATVTHLFRDTQCRLFDLKGTNYDYGRFSRYALLKEFNLEAEYQDNLVDTANLTAQKIKSSFKAQVEASLHLILKRCGWAWGMGYNVYYRSEETIQQINSPFSNKDKKYGIKARNGVATDIWQSLPSNPDYPEVKETRKLNSTSSEARMSNIYFPVDNSVYVDPPVTEPVNSGSSLIGAPWDIQPPDDSSIAQDSMVLVYNSNGTIIPYPGSGYSNEELDEGKASFKPAPKTLSACNIDLCSGRMEKQLSHKFFSYISYQWEECGCWQPYAKIGGEIEIAKKCHAGTINQWGFWWQLGTNF